MEKSFPFNALVVDGTPDRVYSAEDFAAERAAYVSSGVLSEAALAPSPSADGGLAIDIAPGMAVIDGYTYQNTAPLRLEAEAAHASLPRADLAVLRLDLEARTMHSLLLPGTPAAIPEAPEPFRGESIREIPLAVVRIEAGDTAVGIGAVTDLRPRASYILNTPEVAALLEEYKAALSEYFGGEDADMLAEAARTLRLDAGENTVLCGDGQYRPGVPDGFKYEELIRFTASGTFYPDQYPTRDGRYDVILQGGGGSGAYGSTANGAGGGESGGFLSLRGIPLRSGAAYAVTVGAGGACRDKDTEGFSPSAVGQSGGATSFAGYTVPGGKGGALSGGSGQTPTVANGYTQNLGTSGVGGRGGESFFAPGGANNYSGVGGDGSLGSGGGAGYLLNLQIPQHRSGAGGGGVVILYGARPIDG